MQENDDSIPQWQQDEARARLHALKSGKDIGVDWDTAMSRIFPDEKHLLTEEITEAVEEMKLIKSGKKKARDAEDFIASID